MLNMKGKGKTDEKMNILKICIANLTTIAKLIP